MIRRWLLYLAALAGALVFHIFYFGWFSWFLLVLTLALPAFSLVSSLPAMVPVRLELEVPASCRRGEHAYVTLRASGGFLPIPRCGLRLGMTAVMTGHRQTLRQWVPGQESWYVPLDSSHCGQLICAVEKARVYDYLGLFRLPVRQPRPVSVLILPQPVEPENLPNLTQFLARRRQPKPGGGFSEEHDLRDYRPGDNLRDIHWKLSVKTDRIIVREAQEPIRGMNLLTFDLQGPPERLDATLERLVWLSAWMLDHDAVHQILWIDPADCQMASATMERPEDLQTLLPRFLRTPLREDLPSLAGRRFAAASWRCHVQPDGEGAG